MNATPHAPASRYAEHCFVAIGASGGQGLQDINRLLGALAPSLQAVVLVVLHRPLEKVTYLREILARSTRLPVVTAAAGEKFEPGTCYIGEPAEHLTLAKHSFACLVEHESIHRNRTIDLLFKSVAAHARRQTIGVVLSGSLDDGSRGLAAIKQAGGRTMVIVPSNLGPRGMPENALAFEGPVDVIGTPEEIAVAIGRTLAKFVRTSRSTRAV